ncbi:DUF1642 domain-containing protein [Streptococcus sp.]|uniref:DUF1642 domain-containing protein n=1 Tax=Streptococcus sp. TaxID=1306 RepID=UPI000EC15C22|nr:DUF1642 domain-containing protein [Streptococcus sp.]MCO4566684.1 hypothetical protein [Streptococcus infantarius subsp. infantarius]HCT82474.1 hypothetical protein [Streptococcus sp.]
MNKQEALKKIEKLEGLTIKDKDFNFDIEMIPKGEALEIIEQIDEPQKPVVPRCVADWYEKNKDDLEWSLYSLCVDFYKRELQDDLHNWFKYDDNKPIETFVKMKLYGYEVEKDKLYQVELPGSHKEGDLILVKDDDGDITYDVVFSDKWKERSYTKLTEAEIKKDHSWAWQFAEEVEND